MPKLGGLSFKQQRFVDFYFQTNGNGTRAAELAGYKGSPQTLKAVASENLTKPYIAKEIGKRLRTTMTGEEVLKELSEIATAECTEPVRVGDKLKALDLMGKHHRIFNESVDVTIEQIDRQELVIILQGALQAGMIDIEVEPVIEITAGQIKHSG